MTQADSSFYHALIDMGSNGIRFSITNLSPSTARSMPTVYLDRAGISLYDAQYSSSDPNTRVPIPDAIIDRVISSLLRFKRTCADFGVPGSQVRFLATEATRTAINSEEFRARIKKDTGWQVEMLPKEEEGRVGAMGVASSYPAVNGLAMDLGGGSTQLTWLVSNAGQVDMPETGSVSMPYGAAALSRRISEANGKHGEDTEKARKELHDEICEALRTAVEALKLPKELEDMSKSKKGLSLYLSGGGFRGWGFALMSQHPISPYPIQIINGFQITTEAFVDTSAVQGAVLAAASDKSENAGIFRISDRRASQVPAVAFLVGCLTETLPQINGVHFCQGGVREGAIFSTLSPEVRAQHPLVVASQAGAPRSADKLLELLDATTPRSRRGHEKAPHAPLEELLRVIVNTLHTYAPLSKDLRAAAALRSTTTGQFAAVHGVSHIDRTVTALALCERWDGRGALGTADAEFYDRLKELAALENHHLVWWCTYIGRAAAFLGELYPAGVIGDDQTLEITSSWNDGEVEITVDLGFVKVGESVLKALRKLSKCGKKKNWPGGKGFKISMTMKIQGQEMDVEKALEEEQDD